MYISALSLSAILLTLIPLSTVCALPANPSNELHPRKSITYYVSLPPPSPLLSPPLLSLRRSNPPPGNRRFLRQAHLLQRRARPLDRDPRPGLHQAKAQKHVHVHRLYVSHPQQTQSELHVCANRFGGAGSESFSRLSLYSDDNCGTEVKFFEQGANGQHDACTNLSGVGTVLSMKNTSKK